MRAIKARAAEKRQELVSAMEINNNKKIEDLRRRAVIMGRVLVTDDEDLVRILRRWSKSGASESSRLEVRWRGYISS